MDFIGREGSMKCKRTAPYLVFLIVLSASTAATAEKPVRGLAEQPVIPARIAPDAAKISSLEFDAGFHALSMQFKAQQDSCFDIGTACKRLRIYDQGRLGNNAPNASLDFTDAYDPDNCADIYLYDGSPIVCRPDGDSVLCFTAIFDQNTLLPTSFIMVDSLSNASYTHAVSQFMTSDAAIGFIAEYYAPKHPDSCGFIIQKVRFWNRTGGVLNNVVVGEALDWDVPGRPAAKNESGYDAGRSLIYQYGCDQDECDSLLPNKRYAGIAAWDNKPFKNYRTLDNAVYVYEGGPFGADAPLPPDTIYQLMKNGTGFFPAIIDSCQDLMSLVTFGKYNMQPNDTQCVVKILSTSREDTDGSVLKANIDKGNAFIDAHDEITCFICDCRPGDPNNDGGKSIGDAVYIVGYVFKRGPAPVPYAICSGDANGDCSCNVGDVVYMINFIFRSGPWPVTCDTWKSNCGLPLRK
jgi:hypothetical protein